MNCTAYYMQAKVSQCHGSNSEGAVGHVLVCQNALPDRIQAWRCAVRLLAGTEPTVLQLLFSDPMHIEVLAPG